MAKYKFTSDKGRNLGTYEGIHETAALYELLQDQGYDVSYDGLENTIVWASDDEHEDWLREVGSIDVTEDEDVSETDMEQIMEDAFEAYEDTEVTVKGTFSGSGLLTRNAGLIVRVGDSEFQITIVKSR